ncbi:hypothetical protein KC322_g25 [Hortaea werneckii]|nr:hypothetical protein KC322_g25 [Hortaea werneckii]
MTDSVVLSSHFSRPASAASAGGSSSLGSTIFRLYAQRSNVQSGEQTTWESDTLNEHWWERIEQAYIRRKNKMHHFFFALRGCSGGAG